jgi:isopentenyl-diphosphate delta-isomerase
MEQVILVDELDREVGVMEKLEAHRRGVLHRAFSVFLFNANGEMLLQKRSWKKYHSAGLWTNTCCSHPRPEETVEESIRRRLQFEMGIEAQTVFSHKFVYKTFLGNLIENELDHVFVGRFDGEPTINREEVEDWKYTNDTDLVQDIKENPQSYTHWFKLILNHKELGWKALYQSILL